MYVYHPRQFNLPNSFTPKHIKIFLSKDNRDCNNLSTDLIESNSTDLFTAELLLWLLRLYVCLINVLEIYRGLHIVVKHMRLINKPYCDSLSWGGMNCNHCIPLHFGPISACALNSFVRIVYRR